MKGQVSFFVKAVGIVIAILSLAVVTFFFSSFQLSTIEKKEESELKMAAMEILQKLITTKENLAYTYENVPVKGTLDVRRITEFSSNYSNYEPPTARASDFDYRIQILQFSKNFTLSPGRIKKTVIGIEELFNLINGKKIIFLADVSASMRDSVKECDNSPFDPSWPNTKICCLKKFLYTLVDTLSDSSYLAVIPYSTSCNPRILVELTKIEGNRAEIKEKIKKLWPGGGTAMPAALDKAFRYAIEKGIENESIIVLLTDGCENWCIREFGWSRDVARNYSYTGIPVHTIGFGIYACDWRLKEVSIITGGKFFDVPTCEDLVREVGVGREVKVPEVKWEFGVSEFSPERARKNKVEIVLPVTLRYNETFATEGLIKIIAVKGELEILSSLIEDVCLKAKHNPGKEIKILKDMYFSYPVSWDGSYLRMEGRKRFIDCDYPIEFENIEREGEHSIEIKFDPAENKVIVRS